VHTGRGIPDEHSLTTSDLPHPDFFAALDGLKPHLFDVLSFPDAYRIGFSVVGVTIKHPTDAPTSIIVSATKELAGGMVATFNTPLCPPGARAEAALEQLYRESEQLLDGKRAQKELFADDTPTPAELARQAKEQTN
jgi:hypothetical protein